MQGGGALPQLARRAAGAGAGRGGARRPTPNFFFAVRIDDADVLRSARALQRHLIDEEARLWPPPSTTTSTSTPSASAPTTSTTAASATTPGTDVDRALRTDDQVRFEDDGERGVRAAAAGGGGGAGSGGARRGLLEQHMIDVETKLHATLFVVSAPTPALLARTQALCSAWAADLGTRSPSALAAFEMTVESVRCFNKGRGQFVLWAGIKDPAPLERLARDLHAWFVQHEPSLLQSITWTPFTPHATILKVRSFGRGARGGSDDSPGARVLRILRRPSIEQSPPHKRLEHGQPLQQERVLLEGETIVYEGRSLEGSEITSDSTTNTTSSADSASCDEAAMGKRKRERGRGGRGGGGQGGGGRGRGGRSDHEVLDEERVFGRQMVDCIELLSMQGREAVDERGRGGYPVYGRLFLDPSRPNEYLDRAWSLPLPREARDEEVTENNAAPVATASRVRPDEEEQQQ